jgi:hypothetical protein
MKIAHRFAHYLFPRESNNQKAKLLHTSTLLLIIFFLFFCQVIINYSPRVVPQILGYAANIAPSEVIRLTNEKRVEAGLPALTTNSVLSQAAQAKGADMLVKGYWAHVAPDGTEPWKFFIDAGYKYRYAGENLARDFSDPSSAVEAWMASPTHRENILSSKYKEIGVAVVEGSLAGVDTTIIVQFFGTNYADTLPATVAYAQEATPAPAVLSTQTPRPSPTSYSVVSQSAGASAITKPATSVSPFDVTKHISTLVISVLVIVLAVDAVIVARRRIVRVSGRTFAHLAFFSMILVIVLILKVGQIL